MRAIADIQLALLRRRLADQDLDIEVEEAAWSLLVEEGYDPVYGARPLKRVLQKRLENPLASKLLGGEYLPGSTIRVAVENGELAFR
jgi:ATP-dependent Clp protease ATP-binding subunit ClpB